MHFHGKAFGVLEALAVLGEEEDKRSLSQM